jgi:lysophospholipase L1-like esterase
MRTRIAILGWAVVVGACSPGPAAPLDAGQGLAADASRGEDGAVARADSAASDAASPRDSSSFDSASADASVPLDFAPCPEAGTCYLMPVGDSITNGTGSSELAGYRRPLRALLDADSLDYDFVGTNAGEAGHHQGISGWKIAQMTAELPSYLTYCSDSNYDVRVPHVFLLMMGTNDVNQSPDTAQAVADLDGLVDLMSQQVPTALIVVAQIVPNGDAALDASRVVPFNAAIPGMIEAHRARGQRVVGVDMHSTLSHPGDFDDSLHPNDSGYAKMAAVWNGAIHALLHPRP